MATSIPVPAKYDRAAMDECASGVTPLEFMAESCRSLFRLARKRKGKSCDWHIVARPLALAFAKAGRSMPARIAMMAMTTRSSIRVNPRNPPISYAWTCQRRSADLQSISIGRNRRGPRRFCPTARSAAVPSRRTSVVQYASELLERSARFEPAAAGDRRAPLVGASPHCTVTRVCNPLGVRKADGPANALPIANRR